MARRRGAACGQRPAAPHPNRAALHGPGPGPPARRGEFPQELRVVVVGTGGMSHQLTGDQFGVMNRDADLAFLERIEQNPQALAEATHEEMMNLYGVEGIELIMWLAMRGALPEQVVRVHHHYYTPMTTGMGLITFDCA